MKKILFIRSSSIGDIVLTTPLVRCCKEQLEASVHFVTRSAFKDVLAENPYIDQLHTYDQHVGEITKKLRNEGFDHVVDLHKNLRAKRIIRALKVPSSTFDKLNWEKWLQVNLKVDRLPRTHIVDRYFEAVGPLGVADDGKGLDYFLPEKQKIFINDLPVTHQDGYYAFAIGAAHETKCLPVHKVISIIQKVNEPVVLLGGPGDREKGEAIRVKAGELVFNGCGNWDINGSASIIEQAKAVMTPDTGMMHIAAALRKPILSFWGNTIPEFGMYPYMPGDEGLSAIFEIKGLSCRPCSKIGFNRCPRGHFKCMENILEDEVAARFQEMTRLTPS